ncbi:hypothetical protein D3C76_1354250 [compost metagenome]
MAVSISLYWVRAVPPGLKFRVNIRSPCCCKIGESAKPPVNACFNFTGSAPALLASNKPSLTVAIVVATII